MNASLNPALVRRVLQRVVQGQIVSVDDVLRHHSDVLLPQALSPLDALRRHDYLRALCGRPGAELSVSETRLDWSNRPHVPCCLPLPAAEGTGSSTTVAVGAAAAYGAQA
jgi:hypothetical protein